MEAAWRPGDELLLCTGATKPVVLAELLSTDGRARTLAQSVVLDNCETTLTLMRELFIQLVENPNQARSPLQTGGLPESCTYTTTATWLILPVVICLSKRLSHACLSMSIIQRDCERLIKTVMVYLMVSNYLDNRSNSRANTCTKGRLRSPVFIRLKPTTFGCFGES